MNKAVIFIAIIVAGYLAIPQDKLIIFLLDRVFTVTNFILFVLVTVAAIIYIGRNPPAAAVPVAVSPLATDPAITPAIDKEELIKERGNIRSYISKAPARLATMETDEQREQFEAIIAGKQQRLQEIIEQLNGN